jgi:hypothetical protein
VDFFPQQEGSLDTNVEGLLNHKVGVIFGSG